MSKSYLPPTTALFTLGNRRKDQESVTYVHGKTLLGLKKKEREKEILPLRLTCVTLDDIMLSEICQGWMGKYCMISKVESKKVRLTEIRSRTIVGTGCDGVEGEDQGRDTGQRARIPVRQKEKVLEIYWWQNIKPKLLYNTRTAI